MGFKRLHCRSIASKLRPQHLSWLDGRDLPKVRLFFAQLATRHGALRQELALFSAPTHRLSTLYGLFCDYAAS
jgi:hypothetical protein